MLPFIFTYKVTYHSSISSHGLKLLSSVVSFQAEGIPLVFLVGQVCWQQILFVFVYLIANVLISPLFLKDSFAGYRILH